MVLNSNGLCPLNWFNFFDRCGPVPCVRQHLSDFVKKCAQKFLESTLKGELDYHLKNNVLDVKKPQETEFNQEDQSPNKRNGTTKKTVITDEFS